MSKKTSTLCFSLLAALSAGLVQSAEATDTGWVQTRTSAETHLASTHLYCATQNLENAMQSCDSNSNCNGFNYRSSDKTVCFKQTEKDAATGAAVPEYDAAGTGYDVWVKNPQRLRSAASNNSFDNSNHYLKSVGGTQYNFVELSVCGAGEFQSVAPTLSSDRTCAPHSKPAPHQRIKTAGTALADAVMENKCSDSEWYDNGSCESLTVCKADEKVKNSPTATTDRTCQSKGVVLNFVTNTVCDVADRGTISHAERYEFYVPSAQTFPKNKKADSTSQGMELCEAFCEPGKCCEYSEERSLSNIYGMYTGRWCIQYDANSNRAASGRYSTISPNSAAPVSTDWVQTRSEDETYLASTHLSCATLDLESAKRTCERTSNCNGFNFRSSDNTACFKQSKVDTNGKAMPEYHKTGKGYDVWVNNPQQ